MYKYVVEEFKKSNKALTYYAVTLIKNGKRVEVIKSIFPSHIEDAQLELEKLANILNEALMYGAKNQQLKILNLFKEK